MPLTLNQYLLLVITIAVVVAITFLITLIAQLRKTARGGEETLNQIRTLVSNLNETSQKVNTKIDDLDDILEATKKTAVSLSEITWFVTTKIIKPSSNFWPLLYPFIRLGWRQMKKRKEKKNGK